MNARLRKSLADVTRRKGRTLLVALGIFIGVLGLTGINSTEDTLFSAFAFTSGVYSATPDISFTVDRLDTALLPTLGAIPHVTTVQYQTRYATVWQVQSATEQIPLHIVSYPDLRHVAFGTVELTDGRLPGDGEIVMESGDQSLQAFTIGDTVTVAAGPQNAQLRVVGLARTAGENPASSGEAIGYMSDAGLQRLAAADRPKAVTHTILIKTQHVADAHDVSATAQQVLQTHQTGVENVIFPTAPVDGATLRALEGVFTLVRMLAMLAVALSCLLILNTVTTLVTEQTAIIGTMKALGGTRGAIAGSYLVSVALYALLATVPGVGLGLYIGYQLAVYLAVRVSMELGQFSVKPWIVAVSLGVGFGAPLLAALPPLWNGTRISVREALAAYGVSVGQGRAPATARGAGLTWVSQTSRLGLRSMFRKRWRAALTLMTLTLAGASFLVVQTATTSVNNTVGAVRANVSADMRVTFKDAATFGQIRDQVNALPNVQRVERAGSTNVTSQWGTLQVSGYEADTQIYHYQLTSGRWMREGETHVVLLSDDASRKMGLHAGDMVTVKNSFGSSTQLTLTVIGTVKQSIDVLGWIGAAVMPVDTVYELRGVSADTVAGSTLEVSIKARDRSQGSVDALAKAVNDVVNPAGSSNDGSGYYAGDRGTIDTVHEYVTRRQGTWYILYYMLYGGALIVGVVGILGLANTLSASVLERQREIGILRAMGATGRRVAQVFWVEGLALGGIAWCLGALLGVPLAYAFVQMLWQVVMPVDLYVDYVAFAVMLAAILTVATLASIAPTWRASRVRVGEMLRYE
ncbi:MAG: FtsX-like permease family protein [Ktedonobacterales bacterium]